MTELTLYNTLTRRNEEFSPRNAAGVSIYSCGPTVYSRQHLGNLRAYVFADLLKRALIAQGHTLRHVINITDVGHLTDDADQGEDKMERAARTSGSSALAVAQVWTEVFQRDLSRLGVMPPNVWAKATEHIPEQIELIRKLEAKGFSYRTEDGIYFDTTRDPTYGELSGLRASSGHGRLTSTDGKRNPADFALWKFSPQVLPRRQLEWESPWGVGFPGWHIECSAMAIRYLGPAIDIHTGGIDHVAVHHPNEIAQSENALGVRPWVSFWMHGGWLVHDGAKISKSREAERKPPHLDDLAGIGVTPAGFRYYLYTAHYRSSLALSDDALRGAEAARRRLRAITRIRAARAAGPSSVAPLATGSALSNLRERFHRHLASDLDAPGALATLWEIAGLGTAPIAQRGALIAELAGVIGLDLSDTEGAEELRTSPQIASLLQAREAARQAHNFALADALRAQLATLGIGVEDTSQGQRHHPLW